MPAPVPARCDGPLVLIRAHPCSRQAPNVLAGTCINGHEVVIRCCDPHALRVMSGQDATPTTRCPTCQGPAWFCVYCGRCRRGEHDSCKAYRGATRAMAGMSPSHAEEYCACSCDPYAPRVPGVPGVRGHREVDA